MSNQESHSIHYLRQIARLQPQPFFSGIPLFGRVIVWVRSAWNSVSTRWYIEPLIRQQNEFNQGTVYEFQALRNDLEMLRQELQVLAFTQQQHRTMLDEISERVIVSDREIVTLTHDLGKVTYAVIQLDETVKQFTGALPD